MRKIRCSHITKAASELFEKANFELPDDVKSAVQKALAVETSPAGKMVLKKILENSEIAREERIPLCQDCGASVVFAEIGQKVEIERGNFNDAINEAIQIGYKRGCLRKSMCHPLTRKNTGDNTPAIIHTDIVPGDKIKIIVMPKGGGSENMARLKMLKPADGKEGIIDFIVNAVNEAGSNPCPPCVIGVGIGGTAERTMFIAKKALMRKLGTINPEPELAEMEKILYEQLNNLGIGPQGFGGNTTVLGVHIEMEPCHIASLPVAVNFQCHSARTKEVII